MIRAMIVDDEPLAMEKLGSLLQATEKVEIIGSYIHPSDAIAAIPAKQPDVFFLDIEMPETDGLVLADRILDLIPNAQIVFVTAYDEYAIEAFELNAVDYLLKPVRRERLLKTLQRISETAREDERKTNLKVDCLGGFTVQTDIAENNLRWRTYKAQELFAFLVQRRGLAVNRQTILDALWENLDGDRAVTHFHTTLYYLRKNLAEAGYPGIIHHENGLYWVAPNSIICDYYEFDPLLQEQNETAQLRKWSNRLFTLYKGPYLAGHSWTWAEPTRQELEERYIVRLIQLHEWYMEQHDIPSAIHILKRALQFAPLNEDVHERLIRAYILGNHRLTARKHFDELKQRLQAEYGIDPSESVRNLFSDDH